tara:strand:+ start:459 stop:773 length:315 start_codon:yes stop_codon:yes gene_type:complete
MNNKFGDCPARMSDGRIYTDYRPGCLLNNTIKVSNQLINNHDYRMYLTRNAKKIMNTNNKYIMYKYNCESCIDTMLPESTEISCDKDICNHKVINKKGLGQGRR